MMNNKKLGNDFETAPLIQPVQGLICEGFTFLVGASKIGKSWMALYLAYSVAQGRSFWGRKTMKSRVLYLAYEDSQRRVKERIKTMALDNLPDTLSISIEPVMMGNGLEDMLTAWLEADTTMPSMIIIDTFQKVRGALLTLYRYESCVPPSPMR